MRETGKSIERKAEEASEWLSSPEGREAMENAIRNADETSQRLREARKVDMESLLRVVA